jgi:hypothetical protein
VAISGIVYTLRYDFGQPILGFPPLKEYIDREIHQTLKKEMVSRLKNRIDLNFFQKLGAALLNKRSEEKREQDAIAAVDRFIQEELKKGNLRVIFLGKLKQIDPDTAKKNKHIIRNHPLVLVWSGDFRGERDVVAAFSLSFWKGLSVKEKTGNEKSRFFDQISGVAEKAALGD